MCVTRAKKTSDSSAKRKARIWRMIDSSDEDSDFVAFPMSTQPSVRLNNGILEGYDDHDLQWSESTNSLMMLSI